MEPSSLATKVRLLHSDDPKQHFLLVEGDDDSRFLRSFIAPGAVNLMPSYGWPNLVKALKQLSDFPGTITAIVDADHERVGGNKKDILHALRTDGHDMESMYLFSPATHRVLAEFSAPIHAFDEAMSLARVWGAVRLVNECSNLGLKFEDFDLPSHSSCEVSELLFELQRHSSITRINIEEVGANVSYATTNEKFTDRQLCKGKDGIVALSHVLGSKYCRQSKQDLSIERLDRLLRLAYGPQDFGLTQLARQLQNQGIELQPRCVSAEQ